MGQVEEGFSTTLEQPLRDLTERIQTLIGCENDRNLAERVDLRQKNNSKSACNRQGDREPGEVTQIGWRGWARRIAMVLSAVVRAGV